MTSYLCQECGEDHGREEPVPGTRCGCGNETFVAHKVTIKSLAEEIKRRWPELYVRVEQGHCNTDRKVGRLRHPGKGRLGSRIIVQDPSQPWPDCELHPLLDHNNAETYRRVEDVVSWMEDYAAGRKKYPG